MGKKLKPDDPAQSERFIETAKAVEADETREGAERAFRKVTRVAKSAIPSTDRQESEKN